MYHFTLSLSDAQRQRAEEKARLLGYESPDAYLLDVVMEALNPDEDDIASLRAGFADIRDGRIYAASQLDELLDNEDADE